MPAAYDANVQHPPVAAVIRTDIHETDPEVAKEALHQLTWLGVDPVLIHKALAAARQIVRVIPEDGYTLDNPPHPS